MKLNTIVVRLMTIGRKTVAEVITVGTIWMLNFTSESILGTGGEATEGN